MHACLAEDTEKAMLLDTLGYAELWVGEHYRRDRAVSGALAVHRQPPDAHRAAHLRHRGRQCAAAHPAMIAAEAAQFDHLSGGRFILGIGSGSTPTDNEMMNVSPDARERGRMLAEIDRDDRAHLGERPAV